MKKIYKQDTAPKPFIIALLSNIFMELGWSGEKELFNRFCEMMNHLNQEEQELMANLTRDFLYFREEPYNSALSVVERALILMIPETVACLFALPLIKPEDVGTVKSAATLIYDLRFSLKSIADERVIGHFSYDRIDSLESHKGVVQNLVEISLR